MTSKPDSKRLMIVFHDMKLGGIQRKTTDIIAQVQKQYPQVPITLCLRNKTGIFLKAVPSSVRVIGPSFHTAKLDMVWFIFWLTGAIFRYRPTHILSFMDLGSVPVLISLKILFWKKVNLVIGEDILTSKYVYTETRPQLRLKLIRTLYPQSKYILVQTIIQKKDLDDITHHQANVIVSPNWLPLEFQKVPEVPYPKRSTDILFVGRIEAQKNLYRFLEIICLLKKECPNIKVKIIGEGSLLPQIKSEAQKLGVSQNITFLRPTIDLKSHYTSAKVFLMTSDYEGFPLTLKKLSETVIGELF